jgi:LPXTG-site transpeptidase (sortase) family protein
VKNAAVVVTAMLGVAIAALIAASYELTPTPVLGHRDPHATGPSAVAQDVLSASDAVLAAVAGAQPAAASSPPTGVASPPARHGVWIEIPALAVALPVARGDGSDRIPMWQALVYPGTAWPGDAGNSYLYAHGYWGMFGGLLYAKVGDRASIHDYDTGRQVEMRVTRVVGRVAYNDTHWLAQPTKVPTLTLQTCVDYNPKGDRFIVELA